VKQEVAVSANGYKSQSKVVGVAKILHYSNGTGSTTFILDPDLSENSPIRLIVEVRGPKGALKGANVDFSLANGRQLYGGSTDSNGERDFRSNDAGDVPIAELRKGLAVTVKSEGYKEVNRSVPADLLQPSNEARRFAVQLDKDWSALTNAIAALEARVGAWNSDKNQASTGTENAAIEKVRAARGRAEGLFNEIKDARNIFDLSTVNGVSSQRCNKAGELKKDIQACETEANQQAQELKQLLDDAAALASTCSKPEDAEVIKSKHGKAIKLLGEIGKRSKKAVKDRDELMNVAKESLALKDLLVELQTKATAIEEEMKAAQAAADEATENYKKIAELSKSIVRRQIALQAELAVLTVKYETDTAGIPPDLTKRIDVIERLLGSWKNELSIGTQPEKSLPERITNDLNAIARLQTDAEALLIQYRVAACDIDTMEQVVNGIDTTLTNASFELGLAADLPKQAEACAKKAATAAADEVTVPDISHLTDLDQMSVALAQAGLVLAPAATNAAPPAGEEKLFGPQSPAANSKAKRGDPVTIVVYQKVAEEKTKAANPPEKELVVVPSVKGAQSIEYAGIILEQAGFKPVFRAVKPKEKKDELKIADQDPPAGEKKERGSIVIVFIAQKYETPESSTADSSPTAPGTMPSLIGLTLDQATTRLTSNMRIGGDEVGDKPPTLEKALTIYSQTPAAGSKIDKDKTIVVAVKRYGSGKEAPPEEIPASGGEQASSGSGDWVGTWGTPGTKVGEGITISREADGYVLSGALVGKGPPVRHGVVQGGQLLFHTEVDPRDVVGIAIGGARSEADKTGKKKDETFQLNFKFVRQGDTLDFDMESIEPGGKTTRQDFKDLRRMK
jgi:beta-lactam-binding protein with PASTA domain